MSRSSLIVPNDEIHLTWPAPIHIHNQGLVFSVGFSKLEEDAEQGYSGSFQDQDDFPADQYNYVLGTKNPNP
jgi:hypothetical protein